MTLKKHDFIELDFTGIIKDDNLIFDTTLENVAKENNIFNAKVKYKPVVICLGESQIIAGLDGKIIGKEAGKHRIELKPEEAFGKKDTKLLQLIPLSVFKKQQIQPFPGLQVEIDGNMGVIRTSGSRVIVDFNHPFSGKEIIYDVEIKRIIDDEKEKVKSFFIISGIEADVAEKEGKFEVTLKYNLPKELQEGLGKNISEIIGKEIVFAEKKTEKEEKKEEIKPENK